MALYELRSAIFLRICAHKGCTVDIECGDGDGSLYSLLDLKSETEM